MKPGSLPFEYPFRWRNEDLTKMAGVTPEAAALLEQRDRDLEDFLATVGGGGVVPTVFVAASDATARSKSYADYTCGGTEDQAEINDALVICKNAGGGRVVLSEGTFVIGEWGIGYDVELEGAFGYEPNNTMLTGLGMHATRLEHTHSSTGGYVVNAEGGEGFHLHNMTVDGTNITFGGLGVQINSTGSTVQGVRFVTIGEWGGDALKIGTEGKVTACIFENLTSAVGVRLTAEVGHVTNCSFATVGYEAVVGSSRAVVMGNIIEFAQSDGSPATDAIEVGTNSVVVGNIASVSTGTATITSGVGSQVANNVLL